MRNLFLLALSLTVVMFSVVGCSTLDSVPMPDQVISHNPAGSSSIKVGMTKAEVKARYGAPDSDTMVVSDQWEGSREEWFYRGRMDLPIGADYLANDVYLYFDGNNLTNISEKPMGKAKSVEKK
ncbi:MAG TPA: hypothetical protein PKY78_07555 [Candidatus Omnitrophota bacterium]|nr:hypothetical protein [Candidatus Omnitrophota bacterium]HPS20822.1 hypothetical protein [Candidatus Omnitrophota bacterium]